LGRSPFTLCFVAGFSILISIVANSTGKFIIQSNAASEDVYTGGYTNVFGVLTPTAYILYITF
jgi:hypothetical protein